MQQWGDGARAIVSIDWDGKEGEDGHLFIVEQRQWRTEFIDPQTNDSNTQDYLLRCIPNTAQFMRIDDKKISDLNIVKKCIKCNGKKK